MMSRSNRLYLHFHQRGAAGIAVAMLIVFILTAAVIGVMKLTGSSVFDAAKNEEQVSSLYLAESGLERALATLRTAALDNNYTDATCTGLKGQTINLGRGSFSYTNAVSYDQNGNPGGSCSGGTCTQCLVTVQGRIGTTSSRTIQGQLIATQQNGTTGQTNSSCPTANCSPNVVMQMTVPQANSFAFVHLNFNPTSNWGGSPVTPTCKDTGSGSLATCTLAWNITGNYYNNPSSIGIYAPVTNAGTYSLTEVVLASANPKTYNYAAVGAIFRSRGGATAGYVGSFAKEPVTSGSFPNRHLTCAGGTTAPRTQPLVANDCSPYDYQHAYLDSGWTCKPNSDTSTDWSYAGNTDTLLAGFGGKPYSPGTSARCGSLNGVNYYHSATQLCSNQLSAMMVNGQPMYKQLSLDGQQGDYMYSQLWWTYNPAYDETTATASNSSSSFTGAIGAKVTGTIGATVTGAITTGATVTGCIGGTTSCNGTNASCSGSGTTLRICAAPSSGVLSVGDTLSSSGGSGNVRSGTTISAFGTGGGGVGTYTVSGAAQTVSSKTITATSTASVLNVTAVSGGILSVGDTLSSTGSGTNVRTSPATTISTFRTGTGAGSGLTGYYTVSGSTQTVTSRTIRAASTNLNVTAVTAGSGGFATGDVISGTGITAGTTLNSSSATPPAIGIYNLNGVAQGPIGSQTFTSSSNILTVSAVTSGTLYQDDVISGTGVTVGTTITGNATSPYLPYTGTSGSGSTGTYQLSGTAQHVDPGTTMKSSSTKITLTGATSVPAIGTALAVTNASLTGSISSTTLTVTVASGVPLNIGSVLYGPNVSANTTITALGTGTGGTGTYTVSPSQTAASGSIFIKIFAPDSVTASISDATLTVTSATGTNLSVGDAVFGDGIAPLTRITARGTGTGGTGTYTITPGGQTVGSRTILVRPAVVSTTSASLYNMSRVPTSPLTNASLCGGACPVLMGDGTAARRVGQVDLTNIVDYDDWSAGFACVKGIDPSNVKTLVNVMSKQGQWTELVQ